MATSHRSTLLRITGWQQERRRALELIRRQRLTRAALGDHVTVEALTFAEIDIENTLRERAAYEIAESVAMRWAHEVFRGAGQVAA